MLNILTLDRKYIAYTLNLRRYLFKFLFTRKLFPVQIGNSKFLVEPWSSDLFTIYEVYADGGYLMKLKEAATDIQTVVDFGANIGVFSVWVSQMYRPGKVVAVEMESGCYDRLVENISLNKLEGIIQPLQAAIFSQTGFVGVRKIPWSVFYEVSPDRADHRVRAFSFIDFLDFAGLERVDLLKIDIEGAEKYLLTEPNTRLFQERVRYILLETHSLNDFRAEQAVTYLSGLGFSLAMTPTPYVLDHNFIVDAWNPALNAFGTTSSLANP